VNPDETAGVESLGESADRLLFQELFPLGLQADVVVLRLDEIELVDRDDVDARSVADDDPREVCSGRPSGGGERRRIGARRPDAGGVSCRFRRTAVSDRRTEARKARKKPR
jgi:hypothetical protein